LQQKSIRNLTTGSIARNLWYLAVPMMATNALQTLFNIIDMIFVGRLGPPSIAAVSVVGMIMMIPFALVLGLGIATVAMVSRYYGAQNYARAKHVALQSILSGVVGGAGVTMIGFAFGPLLLYLFGVTDEVHSLGSIYIRILFLGSIPIALQFLSAAIFQAVGDAATAFWIMLLSVFFNIGLDPLLIFGIGPFPRLEVAGAAWATTIARTIGMSFALFLLFHKKTHLQLKWEGLKFDGPQVRKLLLIGLPSSLQMTIRSASGIIMMGIVARYGTNALAAYGIGIRMDMLVMMPGFGLAAATATLVGQNLGAGKPDRAVQSSWLATVNFLLIMVSAGILFYLFPVNIFRVFNHDPDVIANGVTYLRTIVISYPFIAVAVILTRALSGAGVTVAPMVVTALTLFGIAVPFAFIIPSFLNVGVRGVWIAIILSNIVNAAIIVVIFQRKRWLKKRL